EAGGASLRLRVVLGEAWPEADAWPLGGLFRARRERPGSRSADKRDELAASNHSITPSARANSLGGTVRLRILAVWWLMTSSKFGRLHNGQVHRLPPSDGSQCHERDGSADNRY